MIAVVRRGLYRLSTIRSSAFSIAVFAAFGIIFSVMSADMWALLAGVSAFGFGVTGITQHYQHRTAVLLYLARPKRLQVLLAQLLTTVIVSLGFAAVSGVVVLFSGDVDVFLRTLTVVPIMGLLGAAMATVVRRATPLVVGFAVWVIFIEAMYFRMEQPLPFSAYLDAAGGNGRALLQFLGWALAAVVAAGFSVRRDVNVD